jgi:DNA excision repair protein ERCC-4
MGAVTPILIQDTREQCGYGPIFDSPYILEGLAVGDYSIAGLQAHVAIERKSISDLVSSLTHGRDRFEKELARARPYHYFAVVIEGSAGTILRGEYDHSCANPKALWESICAFSVRYCPFHFLGDRITAAKWTESVLLKFAREHLKAVEAMTKAAKSMSSATGKTRAGGTTRRARETVPQTTHLGADGLTK